MLSLSPPAAAAAAAVLMPPPVASSLSSAGFAAGNISRRESVTDTSAQRRTTGKVFLRLAWRGDAHE